MSRYTLLIVVSLFILAGNAAAEMVAGLPLHVQKFDSGAIRVWLGDHISSSTSIAIPTSEGLVIIDTTGNPTVDRELRRIIARELGRDDFRILINTHEHHDHTGGNSVYADCTIVGHELIAEGMARQAESRQGRIGWSTNRLVELEAEIEQAEKNGTEASRLRENRILINLQLTSALANLSPVPPTKTFSDRLELKLGDTTFELYYIGGMHTASDIAVLVPEHGMVLTGDTMADVWLTDTPGCLASFIARPGIKHDFPLLLANWNALLARKDEIKNLVPSHWNGELTFAGFENRVKYIEALWNGVNEADANGTGLAGIMGGYRLAERFPSLINSPGCSQGNNYTTITEMWKTTTHQESGAVALYDLIEGGAAKADVRKLVAQHDAAKASHYFLEGQINGHAYRFLQDGKTDEAELMFRINVDLFPESWNVYDSLGEALFTGGEPKAAIAMYEKSLELNPESPTGKEMLERIRSTAELN
jgi:glyoxylase-like metal-dependent hydrolase (beta-lactamase superfamily II)